MKVRRILCAVLVLCMVLPFVPAGTALAEGNGAAWEYYIELHTANEKNAEANVKWNCMKATFTFSDGQKTPKEQINSGVSYNEVTSSEFTFSNKKKKNKDETLLDDKGTHETWVKLGYAPWSLRSVTIRNASTDGYKLYSITVKARSYNSRTHTNNWHNGFKSTEYTLYEYYPEGKKDNKKGGVWVKGNSQETFNIYDSNKMGKGRTFVHTGDFTEAIGGEVHVTAADSGNTTPVTKKWNGQAGDQYTVKMANENNWSQPKKASYNALIESDAPTLEYWLISGETEKGANIAKYTDIQDSNGKYCGSYLGKDALKGYGIELTDEGFTYTPKTLYDNMNKEGVSSFSCTLKLMADGVMVNATTVTFKCDTFDFAQYAVALQNESYTADASGGNMSTKYFGKKSNANDQYITAQFTLRKRTTDMMGITNKANAAEFKYDKAYIKAKKTDGTTVTLEAEKVNGEKKATISNGVFSLKFKYGNDIDTNGNTMFLIVEKGTVTINGTKYEYCTDNSANKLDGKQVANTTCYLNCSNKQFVKSNYVIDAKEPQVTITREDTVSSEAANGYTKLARFKIKSDENGYVKVSGTQKRTQGQATMYLTPKGNSKSKIPLRNYTVTESTYATNKSTLTSQTIPLSTGDGMSVGIALATQVEGEYDLVVEGEDIAKNAFSKIYSGIKLDNKPPTVSLVSSELGSKTSGGTVNKSISNKYYFSLKDGSGTGTLYYMFTDKTLAEAKNISTKYDGGDTSGDIDSILNKWCYIKEKDLNGKNATLILTIPEGQIFNGRLVYYAVDECGNMTEYSTLDNISIANERTEYSISADTSVPQPSYSVSVASEGNTIAYRWKSNKDGYLFEDYRGGTVGNLTIDTALDAETVGLNGEYVLELKIQTPKGTATLYPTKSFIFDSAGPDITVSVGEEELYRPSKKIEVVITDTAGVKPGATAQIVTANGETIDGIAATELPVINEEVRVPNNVVNVDNLPSGAYKLKVNAEDKNGTASEVYSDTFYIRNGAPTSSVEVVSDAYHMGYPIIKSTNPIKLKFNAAESFADASKTGEQTLYYRTRKAGEAYKGEWQAVGAANTAENGFAIEKIVEKEGLEFTDGENTLYVQTMLYPTGVTILKTDELNIAENAVVFYLDELAPDEPTVVIEDIHTKESVSGWIVATDNSTEFGGALTAVCDNYGENAVTIGDYTAGVFPITVNQSVQNAKITVTDAAGNTASATFSVYGIDNEAPTAEMTWIREEHGDRTDAVAEVTVHEMTNADGAEQGMFALIPSDEYTGGDIADEYFEPQNVSFTVKKLRSEKAKFDGEVTNTYEVRIAGATGNWRLGVRAADSLGNTSDTVFKDVISTKDAKISIMAQNDDGNEYANWSVSPEEAADIAVVTARFNVPVYVLSQDKIGTNTDDECFELLEQFAMTYSQTASFTITATGTYKMYAIDELGRTECIEITVGENNVTFGTKGDVTATICTPIRDENNWDNITGYEAVSGGKIGVGGMIGEEYYLVVEPTGDKADDVLLFMSYGTDKVEEGTYYSTFNHFNLDTAKSLQYAVKKDGSDLQNESGYYIWDSDAIYGFKKLVYSIGQVNELGSDGIGHTAEIAERMLKLRVFDKEKGLTPIPDGVDADEAVNENTRYLVVSGIDNTEPKVTWTVSPEVIKDDTLYPTPGEVTFTLTAQDKESGIDEIIALLYTDENGDEQAIKVDVSGTYEAEDEDGNTITKKETSWSWNGADNPITVRTENWETGNFETNTVNLPLTITYQDSVSPDEVGDPYGIKTLTYTITDAFDMTQNNGIMLGIFQNSLGVASSAGIYRWEGGIDTTELIYKLPIEEGKDYKLVYTDDKDTPIDISDGYHNRATARVEILPRGTERGLYVSNNNRETGKSLSVYQPKFEFKLKDKYGYEANVVAELGKTDITPPALSYELDPTSKTNQPVTVKAFADDGESGVASVTLSGTALAFDDGSGAYKGEIGKNGSYSIVAYDKAGNKSVQSFTVGNVDTTEPDVTDIIYSVGNTTWVYGNAPEGFYTARPVTAELSFDKQNVRIVKTSVAAGESGFTENDYTVDYASAAITFKKSGKLDVLFEDDYGNQGATEVAVRCIDSTPPRVAVKDMVQNAGSVTVTFEKLLEGEDILSARANSRDESEIYLSYGGAVKPVAVKDEKGKVTERSSFTFTETNHYTIKVFDKEGLSSHLNVDVTIDTTPAKINSVRWYYDYTKDGTEGSVDKTIIPQSGAAGYRIGADFYALTNQDVTVEITTDAGTVLSGLTDKYENVHLREYAENGMFIFNAEKQNGQITSYGVDVAVIDKTPPVIDLKNTTELIFYENEGMGETYDISKLDKSSIYAYDIIVYNGKELNLTDKVEIDYGAFNAVDFAKNDFDASKPYTITYKVKDSVGNETQARRTVRLVGKYDTVVTINGSLPDSASKSYVTGDTVTLALKNFSGTAYVRHSDGLKTMGEMKSKGEVIKKDASGNYVLSGLATGWHTFYVQTDKRDYFTIGVYVSN